ncbi:MAG: DUF4422 domain-containing protein [Selenomonadaceae bacterium]|nr:DUF4422 domain-containing protein [Selenomonadaceae bacterium]
MQDLKFIPKILLCGDEADFFSRVGNRPFKIIGRARIAGEVNGQSFNFVKDNKIFFNDELQDLSALAKFLKSGAVDYFLFTDFNDFATFRNNAYKRDFFSSQVITLEEFKVLPIEFFYDVIADFYLLPHLKDVAIKTLLDVDGYFSKGKIFAKPENDFTEIDAVTDKPLPPILENIYTHTYKNLAEVGLKRYDACLLLEREPVDFESMIILLENFSDRIIIYARAGSELEQYIVDTTDNFSEVYGLRGGAYGNWYFLTRKIPPENFCNYVVTHKAFEVEGLPEGYKIIHAGKILAKKNFGYPGDDTGENISRLNFYVNEITALYWIWKNTNHTTIGLCHYRRFFTESDDETFSAKKILTQAAALRILNRYDIIVSYPYYGGLTQREFIVNDCGNALTTLGETLLKKYLLQTHPDYLDAFEIVINSTTLYKCNMFITRKNIFDAYCQWLFSFIIDATEEVLRVAELEKITDSRHRLMSYLAERMLPVWLIKNRLRIKELKIMQVPGL